MTDALAYDECAACGARWSLPRTACPHCGASPPRRQESAGSGRVGAVSVVHPASGAPYVLVLVDLDEGVRAMGRGVPGLAVGDRVSAGSADGVPTFAPP